MILSVSRRTDIPAFYTQWFMNRIHEGFVLVRNPMNYHQVSQVSLSPDAIDCIVFWSKNAKPMLPYIEKIAEKYTFYFQYTLNGYDQDVEPKLPPIEQKFDTFRHLSSKIGPDRVIWRYDPVLLTETYTVDWHKECFSKIANELKGCTDTCVFSFIDIYDKIRNNVRNMNLRACSVEEMNTLAEAFSCIACENGMKLQTCAEAIDLDRYGIRHGCCVDGELIQKLTGCTLKAKKDKNQRAECGCLESIDIGQYNTCRHGCKYCYANFNPASVEMFSRKHDPASPFLAGSLESSDKVTQRKMKTMLEGAQGQLKLF